MSNGEIGKGGGSEKSQIVESENNNDINKITFK